MEIYHEEFFEFIEDLRPGLPEIMAVYDWNMKHNVRLILELSEDENLKQNYLNEKEKTEAHNGEIERILIEKQILYDQLHDLTKEVENLKEENPCLIELYEQTDELYQQLKKEILNEKVENRSSPMVLQKSMTLQELNKLVEKISKDEKSKLYSISNEL